MGDFIVRKTPNPVQGAGGLTERSDMMAQYAEHEFTGQPFAALEPARPWKPERCKAQGEVTVIRPTVHRRGPLTRPRAASRASLVQVFSLQRLSEP